MKTTIEMVSKIQPGWSAIITCENIENGFAHDYNEAIRTVHMDDLPPIIDTIRNARPGPVHEQVWSWIGQMHFRDWEILQKRTED